MDEKPQAISFRELITRAGQNPDEPLGKIEFPQEMRQRAPEPPPSPKTLEEARQELLDELEERISDSIDMDWQPSWAARDICIFLQDEGDLRTAMERFLAMTRAPAAMTEHPTDAQIDRLVYLTACVRQGEGSSVRCEGPGEYEVNLAREWVNRVLKAMEAAKPSNPIDELMAKLEGIRPDSARLISENLRAFASEAGYSEPEVGIYGDAEMANGIAALADFLDAIIPGEMPNG